MAGTLSKRFDQVESQLRSWRGQVTAYRDRSSAGLLNADDARRLLDDVRSAAARMAEVPRTATTATKAVEEWNYSGDVAADFTAIEDALFAVGNWIAGRDNQIWTGYDITQVYPWAETVPTFTAIATSGLRTELNSLATALDTFLSRIS